MALKTNALTTALRGHIDDGVVVDSEVDLVANDSSKTHRRSFIFGHVAGTSIGVLVVSVDEVEGVEKVGCVELLVELIGLGDAEGEKSVCEIVKK